MPGGTASSKALLAVAETAQKQEDSAEDGSKGDRLPGAAGNAETGTVDSQAAVRTAGGGPTAGAQPTRRRGKSSPDHLFCADRLEGGSLAAVVSAELPVLAKSSENYTSTWQHIRLHDAPRVVLKLLVAQVLAISFTALLS